MKLFAVSNDAPDVIQAFCQHYGIEYDFLADEGSVLIRRLGILNTLIHPDEPIYGIPYPGTYVLDEGGVVVAKFFHREYQVRESAAFLLRAAFGVEVENPEASAEIPSAGRTADGVRMTAYLATPDLKFRQRSELLVDVAIPSGLHLYGRPIPRGYHPVDVLVLAPSTVVVGGVIYPAPQAFRVEGLDEQFHIYEEGLRIRAEVNLVTRDVLSVPVEVELRYQACTDSECFPPSVVRLHLDLPVGQLAPPAAPSR